MNKRPFADKLLKPNEDSLKKVLGKVYCFFLELNGHTYGFKRDWNFSKSSGWMQKVYDNKKALYYMVPLNDSFSISSTVREKEKIEFLADSALGEFHNQLNNSKRYSEGYALRFSIVDHKSFSQCIFLIKKLIEKRTKMIK